MRILLVEDDETLAAVVTNFLTQQHYVIDVAEDGQVGWDFVEAFTYDLILLDVMLPKMDGMTLCRKIRASGYRMPVLLLTARQTSTDKVMGLDVGADDYVIKPFDLKELGARIRALLRRGNSALAPVLEWGDLRLDPSSCEVTYKNQPLHLSAKEYSLLELFLRNSHRVFNRSAILDHLWAGDDIPGEDTVKAHIKGLRHRFKSAGAPADLIETIYGMGYRLKQIPDSEKRQIPQIIAAGLSVELTSWLQERLGSVFIQQTASSEATLEEIHRGNWSLLILDQMVLNPKVTKVLEGAFSRLRGGKQLIIYCLEANRVSLLPRKIVGQILFHPLNWEELATIVAETLSLSLSPARETRGKELVRSNREQETPQFSIPNSQSSITNSSLKSSVALLWEKFKVKILNRLVSLDQAANALLTGELNDELRSLAVREAHKLAGSLGTYGFERGTHLAREIEELLESQATVSQPEAQRIAELVMALHLELENAPAEPTSSAEAADLSASAKVTPPLKVLSTAKQLRLLIVEDDTELAEYLAMEALTWGINAEIVHNLAAARETIQKNHPDLVLLDLIFPEQESGLTLLKELSVLVPPIPTIVMTFQDSFVNRVEVARLGGCGFLQKPVTPAQVMEAVTQVLQQSRDDDFKLMVVDDDPAILAALEIILQPWGLELTTLDDPRKFWEVLDATAPDLLVLDVNMPQVNGIELCQVIRNDPKWNTLPVLFLSSYSDAKTIQQVFGVGADDFVSKPISETELVTRIFNRLERLRVLRSIAETDLLTGVANRRKFSSEMERLLRLANRHNQPLCFAILDLDHFKRINDTYGHEAGDRVLHYLGKLLLQSFRNEDAVGRWGGEEFVVSLYGIDKAEAVRRLVQVLETLRSVEFIEADDKIFRVSFSAGVVEYLDDGADLLSLYKRADEVLYQAKQQGRDRVLSS